MFESLDKLMLAGLGALSMSRERAEKIFEEYAERGRVEKDGRSGFVKELMESADRTRADFQKLIDEQVEETVNRLHLATKEDIERIESKVDELQKQGKRIDSKVNELRKRGE